MTNGQCELYIMSIIITHHLSILIIKKKNLEHCIYYIV